MSLLIALSFSDRSISASIYGYRDNTCISISDSVIVSENSAIKVSDTVDDTGIGCQVPESAFFQQYRYDNGQISAQGYLLQGRPEGYWENFDPEGNLISEGCRKNFKLEGIWKFYKKGKIVSEISYHNDRKNGFCRYYMEDRIIQDIYVNDTLHGTRSIYDTSGNLIQTTVFDKGNENGFDRRYNRYGDTWMFTYYRNGMVVFRERLNQRDENGLRQGLWKDYYSNPQVKWECHFVNDLRNGYYKEYDSLGNLLILQKYVNGILQENADELAQLEVYTEYYQNGQIRYRVGLKNGQPEGICREYDSITGKVKRALIFRRGKITGSKNVDSRGNIIEDGNEYYADGKLKSKGSYFRGQKWGRWKFFYPDGTIQQEGEYKEGIPEGLWTWYYPDGNIRIEQEFYKGEPEGSYSEYDENGNIIASGKYIEGLEEGKWLYVQGDMKIQGSYAGGERHGVWKTYYVMRGKSKRMIFKGSYLGGLEEGLHQYFTVEGKLVEEGYYRMGKKVGVWTKYDINGLPSVTITYDQNEEESRYNGKKVLNKDELREDTDNLR